MTFTVSSINDIAADKVVAFGADEAVPANAFDFTFDDDGCLTSYWVIVNKFTGSKELTRTARGQAAFEATAKDAVTTLPTLPLMATDFGLDSYNTWKA